MTDLNSEKIILGCSQNKREAQNLLFQKYERRVLGICLRYASSKEEAKDIQQETFIKVFQTLLTKPTSIQSLEAWIVRIAINTSIDYFRSIRRLNEIPSDQCAEISVSPDVINQLNEEDLIKVIQCIPNPYRLVFNLYIIEGFSHKEISNLLGMTEGTSRSYLTRAKEHLKSKTFPEMILKEKKTWTS